MTSINPNKLECDIKENFNYDNWYESLSQEEKDNVIENAYKDFSLYQARETIRNKFIESMPKVETQKNVAQKIMNWIIFGN